MVVWLIQDKIDVNSCETFFVGLVAILMMELMAVTAAVVLVGGSVVFGVDYYEWRT